MIEIPSRAQEVNPQMITRRERTIRNPILLYKKTKFLICPLCNSDSIMDSNETIVCSNCNTSYNKIENIIDLRIPGTVNDGSEGVNFILNNYNKSYSEIISLKLSLSRSSEDLKNKFFSVEKNVLQRNQEKVNIIKELVPLKGIHSFVELGCGVGSCIWGMSKIADYVIGIDISLASLLLANKILIENEIKNVLLLCCSVTMLPLKMQVFDLVYSTDVIEHVDDQLNFIKTGYDLLNKNGKLIFNTPNRFSLFSPEPHTNVWFVGFLPRSLMSKYVFMVKRIDWYSGIKLLSLFGLRRLMNSLNIKGKIIGITNAELSGVSKNQAKCKLLNKIPFGLSILNSFFKIVLPSYSVVIAKKNAK